LQNQPQNQQQAQDPQTQQAPNRRLRTAEKDLLALGIAVTAILLFVGNGSSALTQLVRQVQGVGFGPDQMLTNAVLLNVALVIFGWRRYDELSLEVRQRRRAEARARQMAETDPLTGCLNRRSVPRHRRADRARAQAWRNRRLHHDRP
jgi:hypothetical protein